MARGSNGGSAVEFISVQPTEEDYLRGVVLFGRNVASYNFALARSLLELANDGRSTVPLADLAEPFSRQVSAHLLSA